MEPKSKVSRSFMVATLGIFFITLGFANEFVVAIDIYVEVDSEYCPLSSISVDEKCQEAVNDRVFDAMIDLIVSGIKVLGGILLWIGLYGFTSSLMKSIETEQNDINDIKKRIKKLNKGLNKEAEQDNRKNE